MPGWVTDALINFTRDIDFAFRSLRRSPAFTVAVALLLAIGIGANAAVLGIIDAAYFRKIAVPHPDQLIGVFSAQGRQHARGGRLEGNSFPDYEYLADRTSGVQGLAAYKMETLPLGDSLAGTDIWGALVSGNYFKLLQVRPQRGRFLDEEDARRVSDGALVISDQMWRDRFAASATSLGARLRIGKRTFAIVGIAPPGFTGTHPEGRTDVWLPYTAANGIVSSSVSMDSSRRMRRAAIIGRLAPGATLSEVQTSLDNSARELARTFPAADGNLSLIAVHHEHLIVPEESPGAFASMLLVWAMVLVMHLVACSNVAMLVMARASQRRQELGVRLCLGASRGRIVRQLLVESGVLAFLGGTGGIAGAFWLIQLITRLQFLSAFRIGVDPRIVGIVLLITVATALQFGLWPARQAAREDPLTLLGRGSSGRVAGRRDSPEAIILAAQVALSLVLVSHAAVILRMFDRQADATPGFDAEHVAVATVALGGTPRNKSEWQIAYDAVMGRIATIPGVVYATAAGGAPLYHPGSVERVTIPSHVYGHGEPDAASVQRIGPGYFATIGAPLTYGREFTADDRGAGRTDDFDVVVINTAMAARFWPNVSAAGIVGKSIVIGRGSPSTIIGIVSDIRDVSPSSTMPRVYVPLLEGLHAPFEVLVRTRGAASAVLPMLRTTIASSTSVSAPPTALTMADIRKQASVLVRTAAMGLSVCAAAALLLTGIGLYGLVAGWAATRQREIGIRLSLGARSSQVHRQLLGSALWLVLAGCAVGTGVAALLVRMEAQWWGPSVSFEPTAVVAAIAVFLISTGVAAYLPAYRATRVNPAEILRALA